MSPRSTPRAGAAKSVSEEPADCRGDLVTVCLERKVSGVKKEHICVRYVAFECLRTSRQEKRIVLAPHGEQRRPMRAKIRLELRIQRDVALVVAEQVELHFIDAGSCEI